MVNNFIQWYVDALPDFLDWEAQISTVPHVWQRQANNDDDSNFHICNCSFGTLVNFDVVSRFSFTLFCTVLWFLDLLYTPWYSGLPWTVSSTTSIVCSLSPQSIGSGWREWEDQETRNTCSIFQSLVLDIPNQLLWPFLTNWDTSFTLDL